MAYVLSQRKQEMGTPWVNNEVKKTGRRRHRFGSGLDSENPPKTPLKLKAGLSSLGVAAALPANLETGDWQTVTGFVYLTDRCLLCLRGALAGSNASGINQKKR